MHQERLATLMPMLRSALLSLRNRDPKPVILEKFEKIDGLLVRWGQLTEKPTNATTKTA